MSKLLSTVSLLPFFATLTGCIVLHWRVEAVLWGLQTILTMQMVCQPFTGESLPDWLKRMRVFFVTEPLCTLGFRQEDSQR